MMLNRRFEVFLMATFLGPPSTWVSGGTPPPSHRREQGLKRKSAELTPSEVSLVKFKSSEIDMVQTPSVHSVLSSAYAPRTPQDPVNKNDFFNTRGALSNFWHFGGKCHRSSLNSCGVFGPSS